MEFNSKQEILNYYLPQIWEYEDCGDHGDADNLRRNMEHDLKRFESRTPQQRTRDAVYARGNKWQIENFNATH